MSLCIGFTFQTWRLWPAFLYSLWEKRYCSSNTGIYVSLHVAFQHSPPLFSFPIKKQKPKKNQKHKTASTVHWNRHGCHCARSFVLAKQRGCVSGEKKKTMCLLRDRGESFHVTVPAIVLSPWKSMPVVGRQSLLSCARLHWWKNTHPQIDPLRGGSHIRKMLTYREHINCPAGCQTELHLTGFLLYV